MIRTHRSIEAGQLRALDEFEQVTRRETWASGLIHRTRYLDVLRRVTTRRWSARGSAGHGRKTTCAACSVRAPLRPWQVLGAADPAAGRPTAQRCDTAITDVRLPDKSPALKRAAGTCRTCASCLLVQQVPGPDRQPRPTGISPSSKRTVLADERDAALTKPVENTVPGTQEAGPSRGEEDVASWPAGSF